MRPEIEALQTQMRRVGYVADAAVATAVYLADAMEKPLLVEGAAGGGKTELAKVLAEVKGTELIRLQCYEGLDVNTSVYEWNYAKQLLHLRLVSSEERAVAEIENDIFSEEYLIERPLLAAIRRPEGPAVLLIDEIDRADEGFEAFLLELLSDFQVTVPELGRIEARHRPAVVLTSNRTREVGDALRRRCLYLYLEHPSLEKEVEIIRTRVPDIDRALAEQIGRVVQSLRERHLYKTPGVAETLDWARALVTLHRGRLDAETVEQTVGCLLKDVHDVRGLDADGVLSLLAEAGVAPAQ